MSGVDDGHAQRYLAYLQTAEGRARCDRFWQTLAPHLPTTGARSALDAGGGVGELSLRLASVGWRVVLLDADEGMLRFAPKNKAIEPVRGKFEDARAWVGAFDLVACHLALEHADEPWSALRHLSSALRPGGVLSLVVRTLQGEVTKQRAAGDEQAVHRALVDRRFFNACAREEARLFEEDEVRTHLGVLGIELLTSVATGRYLHVIGRRP